MNSAVRTGLLTASLLTSLATLAASPMAGEDLARPAEDPSLAAPPSSDGDAPASDDELGRRRPAPPPALATFTGVATVGRTRYTYVMVGTNPQLRGARNVVVQVKILPLRLQFSDGTVLDPTAPDDCMGGLVPLAVTLQSPLFEDYDYGDGPRQFLEHTRRMEFWKFTAPGKLNPNYSVRLAPTVLPTQTLTLTAASTLEEVTCRATGGLETMGHLDLNDWNRFFPSRVLPQLAAWGVNASTFLLFLLPNVDFQVDGVPGAVAFHAGFSTPVGTVTYAAAQLGVARPDLLVNIGAMSHEFAEWLDDPSGGNPTPFWGNIGEITGCTTGNEVGDPLTGTFLPALKMPNGVSYQPQETAFFSWFYDQVPSLGVNGWYSSGGTFKSPAPPCR